MTVQFLLKFGQKEHIQKLLEEGLIYINSANFFKQDIDHGRYDKAEGRTALMHLKNAVFELRPDGDSDWKKLFSPDAKIEQWVNTATLHFYCMCCITTELTKSTEFYELNPEIKQMGDWYLLIHTPRVFVSRMEIALKKSDLEYSYDTVHYYDETLSHNKLTLFHKPKKYMNQQEFRFVIKSTTTDPIQLKLGSLEDIAEMIDVGKYNGFRFVWP